MTIEDQRPQHTLIDLTKDKRTIHARLPWIMKLLVILVLLFLLVPMGMYILWLMSPSQPLSILLVDKSSLDARGVERSSLFWILAHEKYVKPDGRFYESSVDFKGFVPLPESAYAITGLEQWSEESLDSLAGRIDAAYFIDTYGVTTDDWYGRQADPGSSPRIYGGLSREDVLFVQAMRNRGKPVIAEFNFFGSPTPDYIRRQSEQLLGIRWSGWVGRYFSTLDTAENPGLPLWIVTSHENQHGDPWHYHFPGIVLVHLDGTIAILEEGSHLDNAMPIIRTNENIATSLGVNKEVPYAFWFDIIDADSTNAALSRFVLHTSQYGDSLLAEYHLRATFPAVIMSRKQPLFLYLAMDAADNPSPSAFFAHFGRIELFQSFFYNEKNPGDRRIFYWNYYRPLLSRILQEIGQGPIDSQPSP